MVNLLQAYKMRSKRSRRKRNIRKSRKRLLKH
jgi:hypothetical protein